MTGHMAGLTLRDEPVPAALAVCIMSSGLRLQGRPEVLCVRRRSTLGSRRKRTGSDAYSYGSIGERCQLVVLPGVFPWTVIKVTYQQ